MTRLETACSEVPPLVKPLLADVVIVTRVRFLRGSLACDPAGEPMLTRVIEDDEDGARGEGVLPVLAGEAESRLVTLTRWRIGSSG